MGVLPPARWVRASISRDLETGFLIANYRSWPSGFGAGYGRCDASGCRQVSLRGDGSSLKPSTGSATPVGAAPGRFTPGLATGRSSSWSRSISRFSYAGRHRKEGTMPKVKANHLTVNYDQQGSRGPLVVTGLWRHDRVGHACVDPAQPRDAANGWRERLHRGWQPPHVPGWGGGEPGCPGRVGGPQSPAPQGGSPCARLQGGKTGCRG